MRAHNMDAKRMRAHNAQRVLRDLRDSGTLSRADLARATRLSPPTVSAVVDELLRTGLVEEHGEGESNGGRKPQLIRFNARCGVVLGGNIGTDEVQLAVADLNGDILKKRGVKLLADTRPKAILRRICSAAEKMLANFRCADTTLFAVCFGAPGMTNVDQGLVLEAANLEGWKNVPLGGMLAEKFRVPVVVDNDVNLAALGEQWRGGARGARDFAFIALDAGIGAGLVINNKLHRGHRWHAGEISHLNVDFREGHKDFSAAGYLETYLAEKGKTARGAKTEERGSLLSDDAVLRLGAAIANVATLVDPQLIILGGSRATSDDKLLPRLSRIAARIAPNCPELQLTELGDDAPLLGSVRVALEIANQSLHDLVLAGAPTAA